jgi:hypothetical protein
LEQGFFAAAFSRLCFLYVERLERLGFLFELQSKGNAITSHIRHHSSSTTAPPTSV